MNVTLAFKLFSLLLSISAPAGGALIANEGDVSAQKEQPIRKKVKVFGVGLSKTATTSMASAMTLMGYKTLHADRSLAPFVHHRGSPLDLSGFYDDVDSVWDIPTAVYYKEILQAYPDSKFILTVRDSQEWYESFKNYQENYQYYRWGCVFPERWKRLHELVYGSRTISPTWAKSMEEHNAAAIDFFKDYPDQFMVLQFDDDNKWEKICNFLKESEGPCLASSLNVYPPFPRSNTAEKNVVEKACPSGIQLEPDTAPSKFAYVMLLCNDESDANDEYLRMTLVLAENVREYDRENDIVLLHTSNLSKRKLDLMHVFGIKTAKVQQVLSKKRALEDPFGQVDYDASACYFAKARALQLLQYDKVIYVDSDIMFRSNPASLFELPGFVGYDGSKAPLNGGLYVMDPSQQAFADIQDIANSKAFDEKSGWFQYGEFEDWRNPGEMHDWKFWCAFSDQGVFYYYYDKMLNNANISLTTDYDWLFVHFAGRNKPFLFDPKKKSTIKKRFRDATLHWYTLWQQVEEKMGDSSNTLGSSDSVEIAAKRVLQVTSPIDPYDDDDDCSEFWSWWCWLIDLLWCW